MIQILLLPVLLMLGPNMVMEGKVRVATMEDLVACRGTLYKDAVRELHLECKDKGGDFHEIKLTGVYKI